MPTTIKLKNSVTTTSVPSSLVQGEVAINITDKKVWVGNAATTPIQLLGGGADGNFTNISVSSVATFGAGTVSAPSITTTGDTNTGIFFPAADTIAFTEGGVESMRIDSSGNVGIGTSSPTARLGIPIPEFSASSTSGMVRFQNPNVAADSCIQSYYVSSDGSDINIGANSYVNTSGSTVRFSDSYASSAINIRRDGVLAFRTNTSAGVASERMRIDSSGNVGIGTSTITSGAGWTPKLVLSANTPAAIIRGQNSQEVSVGSFDGMFIDCLGNTTGSNNNIIFRNTASNSTFSATERMRITSGGYLKASNDGTYQSSTGDYHEFRNTGQSVPAIWLSATNASYDSTVIQLRASRNTTDNSFYAIQYFNTGASASKFQVADSGNVTNTNNSYGSISDIKLKENIVDATPKLNKLCEVQVRNFNIIGDEQKQLGVVAQELEQIFPSMIEESPDKDIDGNDLGTTTKLVKYSVFVPMLIKAVQELNAKVEAQAVRIAELESK